MIEFIRSKLSNFSAHVTSVKSHESLTHSFIHPKRSDNFTTRPSPPATVVMPLSQSRAHTADHLTGRQQTIAEIGTVGPSGGGGGGATPVSVRSPGHTGSLIDADVGIVSQTGRSEGAAPRICFRRLSTPEDKFAAVA